MCSGGGNVPTAAPPGEPLKQLDDASKASNVEQRRRLMLAKGLASTWTRSQMSSVAGPQQKAANLGGTK